MVRITNPVVAAKTQTSATGTDQTSRQLGPGCMAAKTGFTLVELLVVLALVSVIAAMVVVSGPGLLEAHQQRAVFRGVMVDVKQARQQAIREGVMVEYHINAEARWLGRADGRKLELPDGVFLRVEAAGEDIDKQLAIIRFEPDGSSTGGSIELYRPSGQGFRLVVDWLTGRTTGQTIQWSQ